LDIFNLHIPHFKEENVTFCMSYNFYLFFENFFLKKNNTVITNKIFNSLIFCYCMLKLTEVLKITYIILKRKKKKYCMQQQKTHKIESKIVCFLQLKIKEKFR